MTPPNGRAFRDFVCPDRERCRHRIFLHKRETGACMGSTLGAFDQIVPCPCRWPAMRLAAKAMRESAHSSL